MRFCAMAFSSVFLTCSRLTTSAKDCGRYFLAITWYMGWVSDCRADDYARPRVIRGTRTAPLPLLPSGPGGVCSRPLHEARDLTSIYRNMAPRRDSRLAGGESGAKARTGRPQSPRWRLRGHVVRHKHCVVPARAHAGQVVFLRHFLLR